LEQSFINDPINGTGATIQLNSWLFSYSTPGNAANAANSALTIFQSIGNGGTSIGSSTVASTSAVSGFLNPVTWTFTNLLLQDNLIYSAIAIEGGAIGILFNEGNPYPNGNFVDSSGPIGSSFGFDTAFQGNFSAPTAVPFEFNPAIGIGVLGGLWAGNKFLKNIKKN